MKHPILLIFTDEFNSTERDNGLVAHSVQFLNNHADEWVIDQLRKARANVFKYLPRDLSSLRVTDPESKQEVDICTVLKNVGDQLIIKITCYGDPRTEILRSLEIIKANWEQFQPKTVAGVKALKSSLRVAVHFVGNEGLKHTLVGAKDLDPLCKELKDNIPNWEHVWPTLDAIKHDVFGPEMNYAARIAGFPKGGLFVMSDAVISAVGGRSHFPVNWGVEPYPFVSAKGFDVSIKNPRFVYEITKNHLVEEPETLGSQLNSQKYIRIIDAFERDGGARNFLTKVDMNGKLPIENALRQLAKLFTVEQGNVQYRPDENIIKPEDYFIHRKYVVLRWWSGHPLSELRRYDPHFVANSGGKLFTDEYFFSEQLSTSPLLALFSGTPSEDVDKQLRERFTTINQAEQPSPGSKSRWRLVPKSYPVFDNTLVRYGKINPASSLVLLQFQIKHAYLSEADNMEIFFNDYVPPLGSAAEVDHGILQGMKDGYILYELDKPIKGVPDVRKVIERLQNGPFHDLAEMVAASVAPQPTTVFHKIIPTDIYLLMPVGNDFKGLSILQKSLQKEKPVPGAPLPASVC